MMIVSHRTPVLAAILAIAAACPSTSTLAADKASNKKSDHNITSIWVVCPKPGQRQKMEAGMTHYAAWLKQQGSPFTWHIYQPIVGPHLNCYVVRSGNHAWKDFDSERAWSKEHNDDKQFGIDVEPYMKHVEHYFSAEDTKHEHWIPSKDYRYYGVSHFNFKPGSGDTVKAALAKIKKAVTEAKWPYSYAIDYTIGGRGGMNVVFPMKNYADMARPHPTLLQVMTKSLGSKKAAKAVMMSFDKSIKSHHYAIYVYRPDLSTPK